MDMNDDIMSNSSSECSDENRIGYMKHNGVVEKVEILDDHESSDRLIYGQNAMFYANSVRIISTGEILITGNDPIKYFDTEIAAHHYMLLIADIKTSGVVIDWAPDGRKFTETQVFNGKPHGTFIWWQYSQNRKHPRTIAEYVNGMLHGISTTYDASGTIEHSCEYAFGLRNGEFRRFDVVVNATSTSRFLQTIGCYIDNKIHGEWVTFHNNGSICSTYNYVNGMLHGKRNDWYSDGTKFITCEYNSDVLVGEYCRYYHPSDCLLNSQTHYINTCCTFDDSGTLISMHTYDQCGNVTNMLDSSQKSYSSQTTDADSSQTTDADSSQTLCDNPNPTQDKQELVMNSIECHLDPQQQ
jgi:antitoxin component YwqK of YwqJK toxin-antitoxin module